MTHLSQKDEQIARQAEEIESQRRKIESLERELQKCLDPESGEINPALKMGGEASLLRKIQALEKQLGDCFNVSSDLPTTDELESRIYHSIQGLFLPTKVWDDRENKNRLHSVPWWYLREFLFDADLFNNHWSNDDFRRGVSILNDIILVLDSTRFEGIADVLERMENHEFAGRLFGRQPDQAQEMHRATNALISALVIVRENQEHPGIKRLVSDSDLVDMLVILRGVAFFQRMWIDAKPEQSQTH